MHKKTEPHKIHLELLSGKFGARIAEFWFKFIGYSAIAAGVSVAQATHESWLLSSAKWLSYAAIYLWLKYEIEKVFFYMRPDLEPEWGYSPTTWHLYISNSLNLPLLFLAYYFGVQVSEALASVNV